MKEQIGETTAVKETQTTTEITTRENTTKKSESPTKPKPTTANIPKPEPKPETTDLPKPPTPNTNANEQEVLRLINIERQKNGMNPLALANDLQATANVRAKEVAQKFSHTRPNGENCFTAFPTESYYTYGENIAKGYRTPKDVVNGWMNSEGHRANILNPEFTHIGIVFDSESYSWVQCFGGK